MESLFSRGDASESFTGIKVSNSLRESPHKKKFPTKNSEFLRTK